MQQNESSILQKLKDQPTPENVELAKSWLTRRRGYTAATAKVAELLFEVRKDEKMLAWFRNWLKNRPWGLLVHAAYASVSLEVCEFEWIMEMIHEQPQHPDVGQVLFVLLTGIRDPALIKSAEAWLLTTKPESPNYENVAYALLSENQSAEVVSIVKHFARTDEDNFGFVLKLVEYVHDEESLELARRFILSSDVLLASDVAAELFQYDSVTVGDWVSRNWANRHTWRMFERLAMEHRSPQAADWLLKWMVDFPKRVDESVLWVWSQIDDRESRVKLLNWARIHHRESDIAKALGGGGDLEDPEVASFLRQQTELRSKKAQADITSLADEDRGQALMMLSRLYPESDFSFEAEKWANRHPSSQYSAGIAIDLLKRKRTNERVILGKTIAASQQTGYFLLALLVRAGDQESINGARAKVLKPKLKLRHGTRDIAEGELLAELLKVAIDPQISERAHAWLEETSGEKWDVRKKVASALQSI